MAESYPDIVPAERASAHLHALRRFWWIILGSALLSGSLAYFWSSSQTKLYDASAKVLLTNAEPANLIQHSSAAPSADPERDLNTEVALVKLDSVAQRVRRELRMPPSVSTVSLLRGLKVTPLGTSNLIAVTDRDRSPVLATAIANAFAGQYLILRRNEAQDAYRAAAEQAQLQLSQLTPEQAQGPGGRALRAQMHQLQTTGALQTGGAQIVDPATVPTTPSSPRPKLAAIVGAFAGLIVGVLSALLANASGALDRWRRVEKEGASSNGRAEVGAHEVAAAELLGGDQPAAHPSSSRAAAGEHAP
ncbi:MAG TPA: GNVR domain-containing protein [Solirubrobacteraceae bacterium]|nr:GNVR domain-containing protein [Solirubrobacteraceae bacterium]